MQFAEPPEFVLVGSLAVVLFLVLDVMKQVRPLGLADRERAITSLPMEIGILAPHRLDPFGGTCLEFPNHFLDRVVAGEVAENVHMVFDSIDQNRMAIEVLEDLSLQRVHFFSMPRVLKPNSSIFRAVDEMDQNIGKSLRHESPRDDAGSLERFL
jgi:hypothetical protein